MNRSGYAPPWGKACVRVIGGYGVSDPEMARAKAGYIVCRYKVTTTRAWAKCIIFLPAPSLSRRPTSWARTMRRRGWVRWAT